MNRDIRYLYRQLAHSTTSTNFGGLGEAILAQHLQNQGYKVIRPKTSKSGDWVVTSDWGEFRRVTVEVKTSAKGSRGQWQFCLNKDDKHGQTCFRDAELLVLLQIGKISVNAFVLPSSILPANQKNITIPSLASEYKGKYKPFYQSPRDLDLFYQPYDQISKLEMRV